ncbi:MAG: PVC-type heme-binding CxxCH protein [Planctomycetota bacterium]
MKKSAAAKLLFAIVLLLWSMVSSLRAEGQISFEPNERVALVGNGTAERMNLYGHFETALHLHLSDKDIVFRNFGWPGDEVGRQQRPGNYTKIDDPFEVFDADLLICFFGMNESYGSDEPESIDDYLKRYKKYLSDTKKRLGENTRFVLVSPIAYEDPDHPNRPEGVEVNKRLAAYATATQAFARQEGLPFVNLFDKTESVFNAEPGLQYTINGLHHTAAGDELIASELMTELFEVEPNWDDKSEQIRNAVNDKSWFHLQDYRMLNGWYVYGGRRTWDTETFPGEFQKIRSMVAVRDQFIWDLVDGKAKGTSPDDSTTGEVFIPDTMFGSRDDNFRAMREPKTLEYPTPQQTIDKTKVADGFEMKVFASEKEFPELANPTQIAFDNRGRLWVSCMENYPQWLPGSAKPDDRLIILSDTDNDGVADECKTFYDKLICPTGFEFYKDGVLVVDEPRILFLRDTDGDDVADEVTQLLDGIGTDDTHHAMGAWEWSPGGKLHMLEGIAMSTTLETPYGPRHQEGASGSYVWDLDSLEMRHFRTPGQYNPWCLVFDKRGNGVIGDGTNANQHWSNLLSGGEVKTRASLDAIFNNQGIRPAAGNEFLTSRHFPAAYHNQLIYACVINLHGMPAFQIDDIEGMSGIGGNRVDNLIESEDMFFRPVDPKIGPDGALWFGDWCNALIGHMQYSQRDPNRDHEHGRIYRLVHKDRALLDPVTQADKSVDQLLEQLTAFETRTRYRARRELQGRPTEEVVKAVARWHESSQDPSDWREALWVLESHHRVDVNLVRKVFACDDRDVRSAAVHVVGNEAKYISEPEALLEIAALDADPRVRLEVARACSLIPTARSLKVATIVASQSTDKWIDYVIQHTLQTFEPIWKPMTQEELVLALSAEGAEFIRNYALASGPGANVYKPLQKLADVDAKPNEQKKSLLKIVAAPKGNRQAGQKVFTRVCASCHQHGDIGKKFGPNLSNLGDRMSKDQIIRSIVWPNEEIAKGYETVAIFDVDGNTTAGFVLSEDDEKITLGIADGKTKTILQDDIELLKEMKASSMPEALTKTIAPQEFLDLLSFLMGDWVATNPNLDYNLQRFKGHLEVSRQSQIKLGPNFPAGLNKEAEHLLSHEGVRKSTFAFHSPNKPSDENSVLIRFNSPTIVRHAKVFNRRDSQFHDRAKGLTMWVSKDGENWEKIWHSDEAYPDYSFGVSTDGPIRYVKFGLDRPGILHLDRVTFYGEVVKESNGKVAMVTP